MLLLYLYVQETVCLHLSASQTFLFVDSFCLRKITTDPHKLAHLNIDCVDDRYSKLKICIAEIHFR
jgi:hypothetical protein